MTMRTSVLLILLGLSILAAAAYSYWNASSAPIDHSKALLSDGFAQQWSAIRAADKIEDPAQRCLSYPDPPGLHWDAKVVKAICAPLAYRIMSLDDMSKALDEGHADSLDEAFKGYFDASFSAPIGRGMLVRAYRVTFEKGTPEAGKVAQRWLAAAPRSAFALTAQGLYTLAHAQDVRGGAFYQDSARANLLSMQALIEAATANLVAALQIDHKLIPAYHGLIDAARLGSSHASIHELVEAALAVDPADDRIYLDWMNASEPRWGGSTDKMREIADSAGKQVGENPYLQLVLEKPESYTAIALSNSRRYTEAVEAFENALRIAPSAGDFLTAADDAAAAKLPEKALLYYSQAYRFNGSPTSDISRISVLFRAGKAELAQEMLSQVDVKKVGSVDALYMLGSAFWSANRIPDAVGAYEAMLARSPRNRDALSALSHLYLGNLHDVAKAQPYIASLNENYPTYARGWLYKSTGKSDAECHDALRKYMSLVDRDDPYEKTAIAETEARLAQLEKKDGDASK
ncbi:MAG: DUF4034 domain-containing protein [Dokdonella sp.]